MDGGHGGGHGSGKGAHGSKGLQGVKAKLGEGIRTDLAGKACSGWQANSCISTLHVRRAQSQS
jgi:hypothetical protein